jgi:hypothetical protein
MATDMDYYYITILLATTCFTIHEVLYIVEYCYAMLC